MGIPCNDYQGGTEDVCKSVRIRVEIGRKWQASANAFNPNALRNLKNLAVVVSPAVPVDIPGAMSKATRSNSRNCKSQLLHILFAVSIRQALFIAPCSHTFHYKCIKPLLEAHHPAFSCPLGRRRSRTN
ncbi:hypothetical protein F5887DRAFT_444107 [Amanita rubescens]|nr:hypothetical protein F5887DRAFT_444107 [Amanita rubescens]